MNALKFLTIVVLFEQLFAINISAQNINERILSSTVLISYNQTGIEKSGSGFLIFKEVDKQKHLGFNYLITNKHVIKEAGRTIKVRFYNSNYKDVSAKMELTIKIRDDQGMLLPKVRYNHDKEDIVALDITEEYIKNGIIPNSLPYELLANIDTLKKYNISVGDEIFVVGYPDEIYDTRNYSAVFRSGILASLPTESYNFTSHLQEKYGFPRTLAGFLIDASVFSGSSGSLVILKPVIGRIYNNVINMGGVSPFILGIVDKSIPIEDETPRNLQRIGLGVVYSAQEIKNTIDFGYRMID